MATFNITAMMLVSWCPGVPDPLLLSQRGNYVGCMQVLCIPLFVGPVEIVCLRCINASCGFGTFVLGVPRFCYCLQKGSSPFLPLHFNFGQRCFINVILVTIDGLILRTVVLILGPLILVPTTLPDVLTAKVVVIALVILVRFGDHISARMRRYRRGGGRNWRGGIDRRRPKETRVSNTFRRNFEIANSEAKCITSSFTRNFESSVVVNMVESSMDRVCILPGVGAYQGSGADDVNFRGFALEFEVKTEMPIVMRVLAVRSDSHSNLYTRDKMGRMSYKLHNDAAAPYIRGSMHEAASLFDSVTEATIGRSPVEYLVAKDKKNRVFVDQKRDIRVSGKVAVQRFRFYCGMKRELKFGLQGIPDRVGDPGVRYNVHWILMIHAHGTLVHFPLTTDGDGDAMNTGEGGDDEADTEIIDGRGSIVVHNCLVQAYMRE